MCHAAQVSKHLRDLEYCFGAGTSALYGSTVEYNGTVGPGHNGANAQSIDHAGWLRTGRVLNRLQGIPESTREILFYAFGGAGTMATHGGLRPGRRWYAVAALTEAAKRWGAQWFALRKGAGHGPPAWQWVQYMMQHETKLTRRDRRRWEIVEGQAKAILYEALEVYGSAQD